MLRTRMRSFVFSWSPKDWHSLTRVRKTCYSPLRKKFLTPEKVFFTPEKKLLTPEKVFLTPEKKLLRGEKALLDGQQE